MNLQDKVLKLERIAWKETEWLQPKNLKLLMVEDKDRIIASLGKNNWIDPLKVWEEKKGKIWILDGHHRKEILLELQNRGENIPDMLSALFIECKDKKDAMRKCLVYASVYAKVQDQGLYEAMHAFDFNVDELKDIVLLPGIGWDNFELNFYNEYVPPEENKDDKSETQNECPKCGHRW